MTKTSCPYLYPLDPSREFWELFKAETGGVERHRRHWKTLRRQYANRRFTYLINCNLLKRRTEPQNWYQVWVSFRLSGLERKNPASQFYLDLKHKRYPKLRSSFQITREVVVPRAENPFKLMDAFQACLQE